MPDGAGSPDPSAASRSRPPCRPFSPPASTACRPRRRASSSRRRSSARMCPSCTSPRSRSSPRRCCASSWHISKPRSSSMRRGLFPDLEYTFKHALTHEVAYGSVLHERRRALHARIVEAIETLHPDRLSEHVERLAQHALRGEVWSKAVTYLRQAAAKAVARSASREAVSCLQQALGALAHLPESRETSEQAIDLR